MLYKKFLSVIILFSVSIHINLNNIVYGNVPITIEKPVSLKKLEIQREIFLEVEKVFKQNNHFKDQKLILSQVFPHLHDYPLYPYLEAALLQKFIQHVDSKQMQDFEELYKSTPLIKPVKDSWLLHQAKQKNWYDFLKLYNEYEDQDNIELTCYFIQACSKVNTHSNSVTNFISSSVSSASSNLERFNEKIKKLCYKN